jgi:hypothetical protein
MHPTARARLIVCVVAAANVGLGLASCSGDDSTKSQSLADGGTGDATSDDAPLLDSSAPVEDRSMSTISTADAEANVDADNLDGGRLPDSGTAQGDGQSMPDADGSTAVGNTPDAEGGLDSGAEGGRDSGAEGGRDSGADADAAANGDAEPAVGDGGDAEASVDTLGIILATQGSLCKACAAMKCVDAGTSCEGFASLVADGGPAAGESKSQLCYAALSCVLNGTTACYDLGSGAESCYCGTRLADACLASGPGPDSACRSQDETGLETTDPATVIQRLYNPAFAAGRANAILLCLGNNCVDCVP